MLVGQQQRWPLPVQLGQQQNFQIVYMLQYLISLQSYAIWETHQITAFSGSKSARHLFSSSN